MDTATLLSTNALLSSAAALIMLVVLRTRKTYPGFGFWTAAIASMALATAMLVPDALPQTWWVRVLRNALLVGGQVLVLRGMLVFRGVTLSYRWEAAFALVFLLVFGYYSIDPAQINARIVIYGVLAGSLSLATAALTLRVRPPYFGSNDVMLALWLVFYGGLSFVRIAQQLADPGSSTAFEALKGFGSVYALAQILTVQLMTLTLVSMNSQRIEYEYAVSEARLRDSEAQLRSVGDNLPDGFVYQFEIHNQQRSFSYISAGVEKLLGLHPTDLVRRAQPLFDTLDPESLARYTADEAICLRDHAEYSGVLRFTPAGLEPVWLHVRSAPVKGHSHGVAWAGVAVDITKLKATEAELERHRNHLEAMVEERTAALSEAKLAADAANVAKSSFLANMSHEIRTPLNAVIGLSALMRKKPQEPETAEKLEKIEAAGKHLLGVINNILDFSKIEAGKLELAQEPLDVSALARNVCAMVADAAQAKGIALHTDLEDLPCAVLGDTTHLTQALLNLVSNAIKFTSTGSVQVRTRKTQDDGHSIEMRFEVADTGIGIDASTLQRLFSPFEQADASTARSFGGTGLGLAITRRLVQLMGGDAGVNSVPGLGSTFWFTVRLQKTDTPQQTAASAPQTDPVAELRQRFSGQRVLLVEDDEFNQLVAQAILDDVGLAHDLAVHGEEAVARMREATPGRYALCLMDVQMPRMDGLAATQAIRQLEHGRDLPIIAMTANAFSEDEQRCLAAGMNDFVAKPVDPDRLYRTLLHWLEWQARRNSGDAGAAA